MTRVGFRMTRGGSGNAKLVYSGKLYNVNVVQYKTCIIFA